MATYRDRITVTDAAKETLEIGGGFIVNGFLGRAIEDKALSTPVTTSSSTSEKIMAGAANNIPKIVLYYLFKKMNLSGAAASSMGSVGYDVLIRLTNQGINPASASITLQGKEYRILQPPQTNAMPFWQNPAKSEEQRRYGAMPFGNTQPTVMERQRRYGAMIYDRPGDLENPRYRAMPYNQNPQIVNRETKYGFAGKSDKVSTGSMYGML